MTVVVFYAAVVLIFCACGAIVEYIADRRKHRKLRSRINRYHA